MRCVVNDSEGCLLPKSKGLGVSVWVSEFCVVLTEGFEGEAAKDP